jgi:hypothetical protein
MSCALYAYGKQAMTDNLKLVANLARVFNAFVDKLYQSFFSSSSRTLLELILELLEKARRFTTAILAKTHRTL